MKSKLIFPILVLCFFPNFNGLTQENLTIDLKTILELGGANNLTIQELKANENYAQAQMTEAKEWWLPTVFAGVDVHQLWGASMNSDGRFFLDVNRNSLWNGLGVQANWNFADGIYTLKSLQIQSEANQYITQAEKNKILLQCIETYYDLLTEQSKRMAYENMLYQNDTLIQQIQIQIDAGLLYQSDLLLAKSNRAHLKLEMLNAEKAINHKSLTLMSLLNLTGDVKLICADSIIVPLILDIDLVTETDSIYKLRPEYKFMELTTKSILMQKKGFTTSLYLPQLSFNAYGSYYGKLTGPVTPMFPLIYPDTKQLYPTSAVNISLTWKLPLGHFIYGGQLSKYNSLLQIQEIRQEQFKQTVQFEINTAIQSILFGKKQMEIAKEVLELVIEALKQSVERQKLGTAKPFEVFQAQQFYLLAQFDYLTAICDYNKAQFALKVAMGEDL